MQIQLHPFVADIQLTGCELLSAKNLYVKNMRLTTASITLTKKYHAIFGVIVGYLNSGTPSVELNLNTNTFVHDWSSFQSGETYMKQRVVCDVNMDDFSEGDIYSFSYRAYFSNTTSTRYTLVLCGIY